MNLSVGRTHTLIPYLIVIIIVTLFFILDAISPYTINSDIALQIKSIQQWLRRETNLFNSVVLPSPGDLSQDVRAWIVLWPPGTATFFLPMIAIGLPLGFATMLTAYILFILGCLGWIKVSDAIKTNFSVKITLSFVLAIYSITIGGVNSKIGDVLPFGIMPWLFLYTLYFVYILNQEKRTFAYIAFNACLLSFLLGAVYWVKYSAFLASLGLFSCVMLNLLFFNRRHPLNRRLFLVVICSICLLLPVIILTLLNKYFAGGNFLAVMKIVFPEGQKDIILYSKPFYKKWFYLFYCFLGSPGLALFQAWHWLMHIIYFSDRLFSMFSSLNFCQRVIPLVAAGIPGTLLILWLLLYSRKLFNKNIFIFWCCVTFLPFILLVYITNRAGFNYLIHDNYRFVSSFFIFTEILLISSCYHFVSHNKKFMMRTFAFSILFIFFIVPNTFILVNFIKNDIFERIGQRYIATKNRLFEPYLSNTNVKLVVDRIESLVKSPKDIVVLAVIDDSGTSFVPWLEIKQRALPLNYYWAPLLATHGTEGANLTSPQPLVTSEGLRVILVISKFLEEDGETLLRLQQRFLQAKTWFRLPDTIESDNLVSIWYTDLKV